MAGRAEALSLLAAGAVVGAAGALLYSRNSSPNDAKMAILMLVAGEDETREMVQAMGAIPHAASALSLSKFGVLYTCGRLGIFSTGVVGGEVVIAALTELLMHHVRPELVVSCGLCGAVPRPAGGAGNCKVGDVVVAYPCVSFFERRIAGFGEVSKRQGIGETATWAYAAEVASEMERDHTMFADVVVGKVCSGRSFGSDPTGLAWLAELGAAAKDMETAAAVTTAKLFGVPATAVNVVVTVVSGKAGVEVEEFALHRARAVPQLVRAVTAFTRSALTYLDRPSSMATSNLGPSPSLRSSGSLGGTDDGMVVIHVAMVEEAGPMAEVLGLKKRAVPPFAGFGVPCWTGLVDGCPVLLTAHGVENRLGMSRVGTEFAVFLTSLVCRHYGSRCRAVINAGTSGATTWSGLKIADVVIATETLFFDGRWGEAEAEATATATATSPGGTAVAAAAVGTTGGGYRRAACPQVWGKSADIAAALGLGVATVGTGSSFDLSPADAVELRRHGVGVKEMEAAAVVWSCNTYGVPCLCLKSITDIVRHGDDGAEEFSASLHGAAMSALADKLPGVVAAVVRELK